MYLCILCLHSLGKGANAAKTELEKLITRNGAEGISSAEAVKELAKMYTEP